MDTLLNSLCWYCLPLILYISKYSLFQFEKSRVRDLAKMRAIMEVDEISESEEVVEVKKEVGMEEQQQQKKTDVQQIQLEMSLTLKQVWLPNFFFQEKRQMSSFLRSY